METPFFTVLLLLVTSVLLILIKKLRTTGSHNLPPGPWKLPIIGSLHHLFGEPPHIRLRSLAKKYGPLFHLKLGEIDLMVITSAELAAKSMTSHDISFASRPTFMGSEIILYNSAGLAFAPYGKLWAQLRKICTIELLSPRRVKFFRSIMLEEGDNLIEKVRAANGSPVDLSELMLSVANTTVSRAAFGMKCSQQHEIFLAVKDTFKYMSGFNLPDLYPSLKFLGDINGMRRALEKAHKVLDDALSEIFEEHRTKKVSKAGEEDEDLVDVLLRLKEAGELDASLKMDNLKGVIVDLIIGATETTSATMEWVMTEIIRHPEVMRKVQLEVRDAVNKKTKIHELDASILPYLSMVIKESFRVHPPAPILTPRYCTETVSFGGYTVPAGTRLLINAWAIMRDPTYWDDAESFKPERVESEEQNFNASRFQFMPFGGGRRICPGVTFGMASIENVLANLLYHFDWKLAGGKKPEELDMEETVGLSLTRKNPLVLVATPYKQANNT